MSGLGNGYRNHALDAIFGIGFTKPATIYVALLSSAITDSAGTGGIELSGSAYARVAVTNNATNFGPAAGGFTTNLTTISFATVTGTSWLSTAGFALYDDSLSTASANLIAWGNITTPRVYTVGQTASFVAGSLKIAVA